MIEDISFLNPAVMQLDLNGNPHASNGFEMFSEERFEPCRVCGEPSSGWHCGAVTCEACKKFFLRSINGEDTKYKCVRNRDCLIDRATRTQCQYCRFKKCKEVGMTINENPINPTISELFKAFPCSVCQAPSSGMHFGAVTCEGCKGFFRRSIKERAPERYKCMDHGTCEVSVATRNMCRFCRFQRCIKAGMSAQNSRIGRQSNLFKHKIIELQRHGCVPNSEYLNHAQRKTKSYKMNKSLTNEDELYLQSSTDIYQQQSQHQHLNTSSSSLNNNSNNYMFNPNKHDLSSDISSMNFDNQLQPSYNNSNNNNNNNSGYYYSSQGCLNNSQQLMPQPNDTSMFPLVNNQGNTFTGQQALPHQFNQVSFDILFDKTTAQLIRILHKGYIEFKFEIKTALHEHHQQQQFNMSQNAILQPPNMNYDTDTDSVIDMFRIYAMKFLKFIESIPEIMSLNSEDQNELIKNSIHTIILLVLQQECQNLNYFNSDELLYQKLLKLFPVFARCNDFLRKMRDSFQSLKLDDVEYALYVTLLIISPAKSNLIDFDKISDLREKLADMLNKYMIARRNEELSFDDMLLLLIGLRKFNQILLDGIADSCQHLMRKDLKAIRSFSFFTRVYLQKNLTF